MKSQLTPWSPFHELLDIQKRLSSFFGGGENAVGHGTQLALKSGDWAPAVDIAEDDKEYHIKADLPDVEKKDVSVTVENGVLTISGQRRHESAEKDKKKKFHRIERSFGSYSRSFRLPEEVDAAKVDAEFKDGVLNVRLPKAAKKKPKQTEIKIR